MEFRSSGRHQRLREANVKQALQLMLCSCWKKPRLRVGVLGWTWKVCGIKFCTNPVMAKALGGP
ncbi:uncharacterized protein G2W53_009986 [Senna tora]|uniref:Uncharacterized protein n=1 Tax=Senna tora TaxID=362788 RepID=A0A835CDJ0_9FABA|nr:uncharacterized protein G2W53_009986 [Senna tora]